jgi:hypothetical protein
MDRRCRFPHSRTRGRIDEIDRRLHRNVVRWLDSSRALQFCAESICSNRAARIRGACPDCAHVTPEQNKAGIAAAKAFHDFFTNYIDSLETTCYKFVAATRSCAAEKILD